MRKDQAHKLIDKMADDSTWDDLISEIYVRQVIDQGLADSQAGRTMDVSDVRKKYGLAEGKSTGPTQPNVISMQSIISLPKIRPSMLKEWWIE